MTYKPTRSEISRENKRNADELEADLVKECDLLRNLGLADVEKIPDPVKITQKYKDGSIKGRVLARSTVDFGGTIKGGLAVHFDAKVTTDDSRWNFSCLDSKDTKGRKGRTQREFLADNARLGAASFVFLRHKPFMGHVRHYMLPVDKDGVVAGITHRKSLSFTNGDAGPFLVKRNQTWFDKLKELMLREARHAVEVARVAPEESSGSHDVIGGSPASPGELIEAVNASRIVRKPAQG